LNKLSTTTAPIITIDMDLFLLTFILPCIVTNFFIIKLTRCTNFPNLLQHETLHVSGSSSAPSSGVYSLYMGHWYMSYRFVGSFRSGPRWNCRWAEELPETCSVSCRNKFVNLVYLVGFIIKK